MMVYASFTTSLGSMFPGYNSQVLFSQPDIEAIGDDLSPNWTARKHE
jgi:hypothetical protein